MRTITYGGAVSLDGFLAGPGGEIDWLHFSADVQQVMADSFKGVDAMLMGRKTWEVAAAAAGGGRKKAASSKPRRARPSAMRSYVFSRTLSSIADPNVELVSGDAAAFVRDLKLRDGGRIILMGGGELAQSLIAAGLIDEVGLNIHPILLGAGIPVFRDPGHRVQLTLTEARPMNGGCILARYRVLN